MWKSRTRECDLLDALEEFILLTTKMYIVKYQYICFLTYSDLTGFKKQYSIKNGLCACYSKCTLI